MNSKRVFATSGALVLLLAGASVQADGVCGNPHTVTATERTTMTRALETARDALPPPPSEWVLVSDDQISVPAGFCMDQPGPFSYSFGRAYGNRSPQKQQASEQATASAAALMQADLAKKKPKMDALMARMNALNQQAIAAAQAGDQAKADSINREIEKVSNELTALLDDPGAAAQIQTAGAESLRDIQIDIGVRVNPASAVMPAAAKSLIRPAGASAAMSWTTQHEGVTTGHALLLIGRWQQNPPGKGWSPVPARAAPTVAPGWYAVEIHADPTRLEPLIRGIDTAALAATLAR
jgi:hypothetical protein